MNSWFDRRKAQPVAEDRVHYVFSSTVINASRRQVWEFIKPPENSVFLSPDIIRGFSAPGPDGVGQIQVFISIQDGEEHVSVLEVVEEVPLELAVTRPLGGRDPSARSRTTLRSGEGRTTVLEVGHYFSIPAGAERNIHEYEQHYRRHSRRYVDRVKAFLERPTDPVDVGPH